MDLTCLIAAPLAAGCLMTYGGIQVAIAAIALWNVMAWAPECLLLRRAQSWSSALRWAGGEAADWISLHAVWSCDLGLWVIHDFWGPCSLSWQPVRHGMWQHWRQRASCCTRHNPFLQPLGGLDVIALPMLVAAVVTLPWSWPAAVLCDSQAPIQR